MRNRTLSRCFEPIDELLESQNLFRKQVPRDASSLFRAVAEQECLAQRFHDEVRQLCLDYMLLHKEDFTEHISDSETIENHIARMRSPLEWPNNAEIFALSFLFQIDFIFYYEDYSQPKAFTNYGFKKSVILYRDNSNHFDIVYPRNTTTIAGFCQALVYQMLYTNVFKVDNVMSVVDKMLHDTTSSFRKDSTNSNDAQDIFRIVEHVTDPNKNDDSLLNISMEYSSSPVHDITPPFPYRVAKALDPDIYRNTEYDIYTAKRKEARYGPYDSKGLQIGVKVIIKTSIFSKDDMSQYTEKERKFVEEINSRDSVLHGHIQSMSNNHGPVQVFIEEFAKKIFVPYESLEKYNLVTNRAMNDTSLLFGSPYKTISTVRRPTLPLPEFYNSPSFSRKKKKFIYPVPLHPTEKNVENEVEEVNVSSEAVKFNNQQAMRSVVDLEEREPHSSYQPEGAAASLAIPACCTSVYNTFPVSYVYGTPPDPVQELTKNMECSLQIDSYGMPMNFGGQYLPSYPYYPMPLEACCAPIYNNYPMQYMYGTPPPAVNDPANMAMMPQPVIYYYNPGQIPASSSYDETSNMPLEKCCSAPTVSVCEPSRSSVPKLQCASRKRASHYEGQPLIKASCESSLIVEAIVEPR